MSTAIEPTAVRHRAPPLLLLAAGLGVAVGAAGLAGWAPLGFSIVTVMLFAGPHNWYEFRYFLSRMPARWGRRRGFYLWAIGGVCLLTAAFIARWLAADLLEWDRAAWRFSSSLWNSLLIVWLGGLAFMRVRETGRDPLWVLAAACGLIAVTWLFPAYWDLGLVYLHPLVALWFLRRELRRNRPEWLPYYYAVLAALPLLLGLLWWHLAAAPPLPGNDVLTRQITYHAGSGILTNVSSHLLVSTHTFLEMLHYAVWLAAIPLLTYGAAPWVRASRTPIAKKSPGWRWLVWGVVLGGAAVVVLLWGAFAADYATTRDLYFTFAVFHVLAEFPFLIGSV